MKKRLNNSNSKKIEASVIIPTYNRSKSLKRTLYSLNKLNYPRDRWEIVVVDNNSNDGTKDMLNEIISQIKLNLKYIKENRLSFTVARHAGAQHASGELLLYIDDDVTVEKNWLKFIIKAFESNPDVGVVGGPIKPIYEVNPPEWVLKMPGIWLSLFDCGMIEKEVEAVPGPNLCIRRSILREVRGFPPDTIGVEAENKFKTIEKIYIGPGDGGLCKKVRKAGYKIYYHPKAIVYHHIPPVRLTKKWWHARFSGEGSYLSLTHQYEKHENSVKLLTNAVNSLILFARTAVYWVGALLRGRIRELYEFQMSFYLSKAKTEFALVRYNKLADKLWEIALTGVLSKDTKKLLKMLP